MASYIFDESPTSIAPFHYDLAIKTDIEQGRFDGKVVIHLNVWEDSQVISLRASRSLRCSDVYLTRPQESPITFRCLDKDRALEEDACTYLQDLDRLVLRLGKEQKLLVGEIGLQLHLSWTGDLGEDVGKGYVVRACRDIAGYQSTLAVTRFYSSQASTAFPCWDEASIKATFALSMVTNQDLACMSCMPETTRPRGIQAALAQGMTDNGWHATHFETTLPINTSLFAWATGSHTCLERAYVSAFSGKIMRMAGLVGESDSQDESLVEKASSLTRPKTCRLIAQVQEEKHPTLPGGFIVKTRSSKRKGNTAISLAGALSFDYDSDAIRHDKVFKRTNLHSSPQENKGLPPQQSFNMTLGNKDRLPVNITPFHYDLAIKSDVERGSFEGKAVIHLNIHEDSDVIYLNADKRLGLLGILLSQSKQESLAFRIVDKDEPQEDNRPFAYLADHDRLTLRLPAGTKLIAAEQGVRLHMSWSSKLRVDGLGYYLSNYGSPVDGKYQQYAVTQLECASARSVYPCWDEPSRKATFAFSMVTKSGLKCLSCMPETTSPRALQSSLAVDFVEEGFQVVHFETTPPMSTYVTALASGPFECLRTSIVSNLTGKTIPLASWATEKDYKHTAFALGVMKRSLAYFEDLLQIPYPLLKLDLLAVPKFVMGAQENFGLITASCLSTLTPPDTNDTQFDLVAGMVCHEVSHMWFGNLVTPSWWDDLFLKEGFASWLGQLECASDLFPDQKLKQAYVSDEIMLALDVDATRNTHPILDENAQTLSELEGTWDDICYSKGSAVAAMIAAHVGRRDFIRGIRKFLREPHSVSGRDDLWKALASESVVDVESFANTWISTPGYPVVTMEEIPGGYVLQQERFLQSGDLSPEEATVLWPIPLNIRVLKGKEDDAFPTLFSDKGMRIQTMSDTLIKLNSDSLCVYRVRYPESIVQQFATIAAHGNGQLSAQDLIGLLDDCFALSFAGYYTPAVALGFLSTICDDPAAHVSKHVDKVLRAYLARWEGYIDIQSGIKALLRKVFGDKAQELGLQREEDDAVLDQCRREAAVTGALFGKHQVITCQAMELFDSAMKMGTLEGISSELRLYLSSADDILQQVIAIALCNASSSEVLAKVLGWLVENGQSQHLYQAINFATKSSAGNEAATWIMGNFGKLEGRLDRGTVKRLVRDGFQNVHDEAIISEVERFFSDAAYSSHYGVDSLKALEVCRSRGKANQRDYAAVLNWFAEHDIGLDAA
ncbi:hypothetical protein QFC21_006047 [Naganishia friedmannii]|uniref:Uncharacterized protein n=1 Tax=Naganishia friedmannii TaxID=89922 RepID=A0ACC2V5A5_9TREE|nr:hypothetical protein QFC21_006047 [Naganishia friedmannii]